MTVNSENTKTSEISPASIDVEKQENGTVTPPPNVAIENNNHFFEEKVKEKAFSGINGSLVFLYAVCFSVFTIGWVNLNRCPISRLIPIYLILAGFLGALAKFISKFDNKYGFWATIILVILNLLWHMVVRVCCRDNVNYGESACPALVNPRWMAGVHTQRPERWDHWTPPNGKTMLIADLPVSGPGTYVVYTEYQPNYNSRNGLYCNRTAYLVAFWSLTIEYTLLLFFILLSCCYMLMRRDFRTESGTK